MNLNLIDTHAHLNFPDFKDDLEQVIKRSLKNGVTKIICVSSNLADSAKAIEIAKKYPGIVYAAVGIHPHQTDFQEKGSLEEQIKQLEELVKNNKVIAIGECGLDFSPTPPMEKDRNKKDQIFLFQEQLKIAQRLSLPVCLHSRKALDDVLLILEKIPVRGILHCYAGGKKDIAKVLALGLYFGLDGNLTYDVGLQNVAKIIPLEKILLETDSPFLTPQPYRCLRNEPKNVKIIAEFLAQLKGLPLNQLAKVVTENTYAAFFGKTR